MLMCYNQAISVNVLQTPLQTSGREAQQQTGSGLASLHQSSIQARNLHNCGVFRIEYPGLVYYSTGIWHQEGIQTKRLYAREE